MPKFKLHLLGKEKDVEKEVGGENLEQACMNAGLTHLDLMGLDYYTNEAGEKIQVFCEADCDCIQHAEDGISCQHDLARVGINYVAPSFASYIE